MNSPLEHILPALNGPFTQEGLAQSLAPNPQEGLERARMAAPISSQSRQDVAGAIAGPSLVPQDPRTPRSAPDSIKALSQILRILAPLPAHTRNAIIGFILAEYPLQ